MYIFLQWIHFLKLNIFYDNQLNFSVAFYVTLSEEPTSAAAASAEVRQMWT